MKALSFTHDNELKYIIENGISGHTRTIDGKCDDYRAAAELVSEANACRRGSGTGLFILWRNNKRASEARVHDGRCVYWGARGFSFQFHGLETGTTKR